MCDEARGCREKVRFSCVLRVIFVEYVRVNRATANFLMRFLVFLLLPFSGAVGMFDFDESGFCKARFETHGRVLNGFAPF